MSTQTKIRIIPKNSLLNETKKEFIWKVVLFNCYCHTYDEAVEQIMLTLKCGYGAGGKYADSAEKFGSVDIYEGSFSECTSVANVLGSTGLDVKITQ
jgi:hypothetical protein